MAKEDRFRQTGGAGGVDDQGNSRIFLLPVVLPGEVGEGVLHEVVVTAKWYSYCNHGQLLTDFL